MWGEKQRERKNQSGGGVGRGRQFALKQDKRAYKLKFVLKQDRRVHKLRFVLKQHKRASYLQFALKQDRRIHKFRFVLKQNKRASKLQFALKQDKRAPKLKFALKQNLCSNQAIIYLANLSSILQLNIFNYGNSIDFVYFNPYKVSGQIKFIDHVIQKN